MEKLIGINITINGEIKKALDEIYKIVKEKGFIDIKHTFLDGQGMYAEQLKYVKKTNNVMIITNFSFLLNKVVDINIFDLNHASALNIIRAVIDSNKNRW